MEKTAVVGLGFRERGERLEAVYDDEPGLILLEQRVDRGDRPREPF